LRRIERELIRSNPSEGDSNDVSLLQGEKMHRQMQKEQEQEKEKEEQNIARTTPLHSSANERFIVCTAYLPFEKTCCFCGSDAQCEGRIRVSSWLAKRD
jgi:hypothetical protein